MLKLNFTPESAAYSEATKSYKNIWDSVSNRVIFEIEKTTSLKFKNQEIEVIIFEGMSQSHPMKLRASYDDETKCATLVHELVHRIFVDNGLKFCATENSQSFEIHKAINLVLYDMWLVLFGQEVAKRQVAMESSRTLMYKSAWVWAMSLTKEVGS